MAAASYYDAADIQGEKPQISSPRGPQITGTNPEDSTQGLSQKLYEGVEQRGLPQQGYNEQAQHGLPQESSNEQYLHQNFHEQNFGQQQQQMGQPQQMGNVNYAHGGPQQQMNGAGNQAAVADNRDTMTKCNDNPPDYIVEFCKSRFLPLQNSIVRHHICRILFDCTLCGYHLRVQSSDHVPCVYSLGLDRIEKKFGGDRFNNPENLEKNRKLNENILKRLKQVGMLVV